MRWSASVGIVNPEWGDYWTHTHGCDVVIADHVYDLRETLKFLARQEGQTYCRGSYVNESFRASFSRAVRGLLKRHLLKEIDFLVPVKEVVSDPMGRVHYLSDGIYVGLSQSKQIRFVVKC